MSITEKQFYTMYKNFCIEVLQVIEQDAFKEWFVDFLGLCSNFSKYVYDSDQSLYVEYYQDFLHDVVFDGKDYPFNEDRSDYNNEYYGDFIYQNELRLAHLRKYASIDLTQFE